MLDKIPNIDDMIALVGQSLYDVWQKLCSAIDEQYDMDCIWNSGGKAWTYEYKYRRGGKTWLMFEPVDTSLFGDFMQLLAIKRRPNRK